MEGSHISFIIRAIYNVQAKGLEKILPNPCNSESLPQLLQNQFVPMPLHLETQQVITLEGRKMTNNALLPTVPGPPNTTSFVRTGQLLAKPSARMETILPDTAREMEDAG